MDKYICETESYCEKCIDPIVGAHVIIHWEKLKKYNIKTNGTSTLLNHQTVMPSKLLRRERF